MSKCITDDEVFDSDISMVMRIDSSDVLPELVDEDSGGLDDEE